MTRETYKLFAIDKVFYGIMIDAVSGARLALEDGDKVYVIFGKPDGSVVKVTAQIDTLGTIEGTDSETKQIHLIQNDPLLFDQVGDWYYSFVVDREDKEYGTPEKEYFWVVA